MWNIIVYYKKILNLLGLLDIYQSLLPINIWKVKYRFSWNPTTTGISQGPDHKRRCPRGHAEIAPLNMSSQTRWA